MPLFQGDFTALILHIRLILSNTDYSRLPKPTARSLRVTSP